MNTIFNDSVAKVDDHTELEGVKRRYVRIWASKMSLLNPIRISLFELKLSAIIRVGFLFVSWKRYIFIRMPPYKSALNIFLASLRSLRLGDEFFRQRIPIEITMCHV